jgi:hypothetical protein
MTQIHNIILSKIIIYWSNFSLVRNKKSIFFNLFTGARVGNKKYW